MGEKKIKGRKRHIVTDTQGHLLHVKVHAANTHDTVSGCGVFHSNSNFGNLHRKPAKNDLFKALKMCHK